MEVLDQFLLTMCLDTDIISDKKIVEFVKNKIQIVKNVLVVA